MAISFMLGKVNQKTVINFILFQALWFACVFGAANGRMLSSWILFATLVYFHSCRANRNTKDLIFTMILLPIGLLLDSIWAFNGLIEYKIGLPFNGLSPYWIAILWVSFALSLNHSMKWIFNYPKLALAFGMIGGPLSYLAAERIGAITINHSYITILLLALSWLVTMLLILFINKKLDVKNEVLQHA